MCFKTLDEYKQSRFNFWFSHKGSEYVFNTKTGSLIMIERGYLPRATLDEIKALFDNGILVERDCDEVSDFEKLTEAAINRKPDSLDITLVLTEACNFNCDYCFETHNSNRMTETDIDRLASLVDRLTIDGVKKFRIQYYGGEPLLNSRLILRADQIFRSKERDGELSYDSYITTNGSLFTDDIIKSIQFDTVQLTFDGDQYYHDLLKKSTSFHYRDLLDLVDRLLSRTSSKIVIRFNVCLENKESFFTTLERIGQLPNFNPSRIRITPQRLKTFPGNRNFTEISPMDYSDVYLRIVLAAKEIGLHPTLPYALSTPCKFSTGNAVCFGPGLKPYFCSMNYSDSSFNINLNKHYTLRYPDVCRRCMVLPLCQNFCALRAAGKDGCIPEKYILKNLLSDYLDNPDSWLDQTRILASRDAVLVAGESE